VGMEDVVIVDTEDAVLVLPRSRAQDVKRLVEQLAAQDAGTSPDGAGL
jgi:mannose-1-phosphate guanylyltransferase